MNKEKFWGNAVKYLALAMVTFGGGYEIYYGIINHSIKSSLLLISLSFLLFIARFFYALSSGAKKSIISEAYGAIVMFIVILLYFYYN